MHLVVFSYKPCWQDPSSPTGFATDGGFPFQMAALAELFDRTTLVLPRRSTPRPPGLCPLVGRRLEVEALPEPAGTNLRRKLALLLWLPRHLGTLWRATGRADAVHAPVPGDLGVLGLGLALVRRKPLFVRHCGTWNPERPPATVADRLLHRLLVRIAGGRRVVLATGGGEATPEPANTAIDWIFSTALEDASLDRLPASKPWRPGRPPRLVQVGRLTRGKNAATSLRALERIRAGHPGATLKLVGHGPERASLERLAAELGLEGAVAFHGNLAHEEVLERLTDADLMVFPTRVAEGFPKAVLEGMACGLPVVASPVSVLPDLLGDGRGILLADTDAETLAEAVLGVLADPDALERTATAARRHARRFTLEGWRDAIGERLEAAWDRPLRDVTEAD